MTTLSVSCGYKNEKDMNKTLRSAAKLHEKVPPDWYYRSMKINIGQRFWHTTRFMEIKKLIEPVDGKVLDIGCDDGMFTKVIRDTSKAKEVIGIDVLKSSVDWSKKHWSKYKNMRFKMGNAHKLKFRDDMFDAVFALEVLEHVPQPKLVLLEIKRVLIPGGYAVFLVPTDSTLFNAIWFIWTKFWRGRIWDDCHIQSYTKDSLVSIAKKCGFEIVENRKFLLGMLQVIKVRKK